MLGRSMGEVPVSPVGCTRRRGVLRPLPAVSLGWTLDILIGWWGRYVLPSTPRSLPSVLIPSSLSPDPFHRIHRHIDTYFPSSYSTHRSPCNPRPNTTPRVGVKNEDAFELGSTTRYTPPTSTSSSIVVLSPPSTPHDHHHFHHLRPFILASTRAIDRLSRSCVFRCIALSPPARLRPASAPVYDLAWRVAGLTAPRSRPPSAVYLPLRVTQRIRLHWISWISGI